MRCVQRADDAFGMDDRSCAVRVPELVRSGEPVPLELTGTLGETPELRGVRCDDQRAALGEPAVDLFSLDHLADQIDAALHGAHHPRRGAGAGAFEGREGSGLIADTPSPVAARCAEARGLPLEHRHAEAGIAAHQVVGRPHPGEARTHDGDVHIEIASEGRAGSAVVTGFERVVPQRLRVHANNLDSHPGLQGVMTQVAISAGRRRTRRGGRSTSGAGGRSARCHRSGSTWR